MSEIIEILVGSCRQANLRRICSKLEGKAKYSTIGNWEEFELESKKCLHSLFVTDLHFSDCFKALAFSNICDSETLIPSIILLDDMEYFSTYRKEASWLIEIYPEAIAEDGDFFSILLALRTKHKYLSGLIKNCDG